jgi:hypothetical protein
VGVLVGARVGLGVRVGRLVGVGVAVGVGRDVRVGVAVAVGLGFAVAVAVRVGLGVDDGVRVGVTVGSSVVGSSDAAATSTGGVSELDSLSGEGELLQLLAKARIAIPRSIPTAILTTLWSRRRFILSP